MGTRSVTVDRFNEIERRLRDGRGLREIARALKCSRKTVREVRDGLRLSPATRKATPDPLWMSQIEWPAVLHDLGLGHPLKFIWEERAQSLTGYPNFWKQLYRKFPELKQATVTAREFVPGERVEVDYAGDPIRWVDLRTGEIREAAVFVAGLGYSHLLFAWAADDMKSHNWLDCHQRMYAFYGGVPHVTVPDCLKQGVLKCHLYDPDLNPSYAALAAHYATAVVPARPGHPKDKAIVEGLVKILMRYQRFRYRRHRFTSLVQINEALAECVRRINDRRHTRFGVTRRERFVADEIDILVDLAGYTEHSRPRVLALRPAPIQVGWLGYPGTMGGNLIDYLIADEVVLPVALEGGYSERIVRLPGSCLPNHANRPIGPPRPKAQLGLPVEGVVLCAFVPTVKITPPLFDLWMSILRERPATCLWLQQAHDEAINNLRHEAQLRGVTPDRLIFAAFEADHAAHLSRYEVADIALDTYPYGSHSTAADALWVGCPLVSRQGLSFAARVSSSALSAVGLAELIAVTDLDYKNLVLRLVDDAAHRAVLRQRLRAARENALLFDSVAYARHLDRAYLEMQRQALRGQPPQSFLVPA